MILPDAAAPETSDVLLFSWNVNQSRDALLLACDYLAGAGNFRRFPRTALPEGRCTIPATRANSLGSVTTRSSSVKT